MTRIQLRRDTATNWATNNPIPSAGEPCFEVDTGKLKIGDGSTAYNDLAYQGGGGSGGGAEIDDTTTSTSKVWSSSKTNTEIQSVADEVTSVQSDVTDLKTTVNGNTSDILTLKTSVAEKQPKLTTGDNITINESTNTISASDVMTTNTSQSIGGYIEKSFDTNWYQTNTSGLYGTFSAAGIYMGYGTNSDNNPHIKNYSSKPLYIQTDTTRTKNQGLKITADTLSFINSSGNETDLLGGSGDNLIKSVDSNFSVSDDGQLSLANTLSIGSSVTAGTLTASTQVGTPAIRFGTYGGAYVRPEITYNTTDGMKINARALESTGNVMKPVTVIASEFKAGDNSNQYDVVTKSPDNNTYMAHMAMPSDTYVDLTLGASGATYTAPADGFYMLRLPSTSEQGTYMDANLKLDGILIGTDTYIISFVGDTCSIFMPAPKNAILQIGYNLTFSEGAVFRFIYANGSEPST